MDTANSNISMDDDVLYRCRQETNYLRTLRKTVNMKQNAAARLAGITPAYLCQIEKGSRTNMSLNLYWRLVVIYERELSRLTELELEKPDGQ